jgi:phasin family protein
MQTQDFTKFAGVEQMETAVKAGKETFDKAMKASKQNADKAYKAGADAVAKGVDGIFAVAKEQVEKAFPQAAPRFDELAELNKGNLDAILAAGAIAKKGMETMADEFAAYNQEAIEESIAGVKAMLGIKTFQDWVEFQTAYARGVFDKTVANTTKLSEMSAKVATEMAEPMQARFTKVSEKYTKPAKTAATA